MNSTTMTGGIPGVRVNRLEVLLWCALGAAVVVGHLLLTHGTVLSNDSYQYLSSAHNFLSGRPAYTSIIHFDSERSFGRVPAPLTTFPPGYPFLVAAIGTTGLPLESSALLGSVAAFLMLIPLSFYALRMLSVDMTVTRFFLVWLIGNSWTSIYGTAAAAESLFTLTSFAAVVLFIKYLTATDPDATRGRTLAMIGVLVGLSYWIRYAGIFLLVAITLFCAAQSFEKRRRPFRLTFLPLGPAYLIVAASMLRNELLVGDWKGGNSKVVHHSLATVLREFAVWFHHLFLGGIADARVGLLEALLLIGALCVAASVCASIRSAKASPPPASMPVLGPSLFLACYLAVYCAGMVYLGVTSVISFDTRMFYPILPCVLLLLARLVSSGLAKIHGTTLRRVASVGLVIATVSYVGINARSYAHAPKPEPQQIAALELSGEVAPHVTMRSWLQLHVPVTQPIVANRGQATGYLLQRDTVSLVSSEYSDQKWTEDAVRALMHTYRARFLVLYVGSGGDAVLKESPFLSLLAAGRPPGWLTLAAHNHEVLVFRSAS